MRKLAGLTLLLVGSVNLVGCAIEDEEEECLPGDADCNDTPLSDGKVDGFDDQNDPSAMARHLEYQLKDLPLKGWRDKPAWKNTYRDAVDRIPTIWADTYWPAADGSHNARWRGPTEKSPLEKYDAAFNAAPGCATQPPISGDGAKAAWEEYNRCAGPAAKWQTEHYEQIGSMHNGIDDNGDGAIDKEGPDSSKGVDGVQRWWGTCHAWAPAAQVIPEPQHAVTMNGVEFGVGDIKALIQNVFDRTGAVMLGGRCNAKEITHDVTGSANDDCSDVNPGALHVVMTNFLGIRQLPLVEDRTANYEVWNQPVAGYEITEQTEVSAAAAMTCVGATGGKYTYNTKAKKLYEVKMTVSYVTESDAGNAPIGFSDNIRTDDYHYILEIGSWGKVIGGRYCADGADTNIDFLWAPTGSHYASNPSVDVDKVKELIKASITAR